MNKLEKDYNMFDWWKKVFLKNYANFEGRARRAEYWYFNLVNMFFLIPFYILLIVAVFQENTFFIGITTIIFLVAALVITIPSIAVSVRRLHDTNKSGWMYLLAIVPVASLVVFIFTVLEGDKHANRYGNDPKNPNADNELNQIGLE
jgi:uncharacterized membrane protein YhaH (DUF805 family)